MVDTPKPKTDGGAKRNLDSGVKRGKDLNRPKTDREQPKVPEAHQPGGDE